MTKNAKYVAPEAHFKSILERGKVIIGGFGSRLFKYTLASRVCSTLPPVNCFLIHP